MNGSFEMGEDEFDELSLQTQLGALFRQSKKNFGVLSEIKEQCECRQKTCEGQFATKEDLDKTKKELKRELSTKSVLSKAIVAGISSASGFVGGLFGSKVG